MLPQKLTSTWEANRFAGGIDKWISLSERFIKFSISIRYRFRGNSM